MSISTFVSYYNNSDFSDVKISFEENAGQNVEEFIYAHKIVLSASSNRMKEELSNGNTEFICKKSNILDKRHLCEMIYSFYTQQLSESFDSYPFEFLNLYNLFECDSLYSLAENRIIDLMNQYDDEFIFNSLVSYSKSDIGSFYSEMIEKAALRVRCCFDSIEELPESVKIDIFSSNYLSVKNEDEVKDMIEKLDLPLSLVREEDNPRISVLRETLGFPYYGNCNEDSILNFIILIPEYKVKNQPFELFVASRVTQYFCVLEEFSIPFESLESGQLVKARIKYDSSIHCYNGTSSIYSLSVISIEKKLDADFWRNDYESSCLKGSRLYNWIFH